MSLAQAFWSNSVLIKSFLTSINVLSLSFIIACLSGCEVLPIPDAKLWRWMLPQEKQKEDHFRRKVEGS